MITVNICGYDSMHKTAMDMYHPHGLDDYLLLLIKTHSFFEKNGSIIEMSPNTVLIYGAHTYIHYYRQEPHYNDDWFSFELLNEDHDLLEKLSIPLDEPFSLPHMGTLTEYSKLIVMEKLSSHPYKQDVVNSLMHALFYSISNQLQDQPIKNSKYYSQISELRTEILNTPYKNWDIPELAARMKISISHFQHLYKEFFGATCTQDIISARVNLGQFYLRTTEMSITELASFCGYKNHLHFMRQFKQLTGITPSQYRTINRQKENRYDPDL